MSFTTPPTARLLVVLAAASVLGCSSDATSPTAGGNLSLSFATQSPATSAGDASFSLIPVTIGTHTLEITSVDLNLSKIELHTSDFIETVTKCEKGHPYCEGIPGSPLMVTLTPEPSLFTITTTVAPKGTYREIELGISSVRLVGTFDGKAFDVVVNVNVDHEITFDPPVLIGEGTDAQRNITITAPIVTWLINTDGTLIDPSKIVDPGTLRSVVEKKIQASLRAFRDDNHNGRDDDNDEHEGHGN